MYKTPRERQQEQRDYQRQQVADICANMKTRFTAKTPVKTVWNECLQRHVEMR